MHDFGRDVQLVYNPELRFRNEGARCIAYSIDDFFFSPDHVTVLLPQEVITLLLFDGTRTFSEAARDMAYVFSVNTQGADDEAEQALDSVIEALEKRMNFEPLIMAASDVPPEKLRALEERYPDPSIFIIAKENIVFDPRDLRLNQPLSVNYNVMTSCGFKCKYCYHPLVPVNELIPLARLREIFAELRAMGCESIMLTGGDPMLRPDIDEVMKALHENKLMYSLSTKSVLPRARIQKLRDEAGLRGMQVSLDSDNPAVVQALLGISDPDYVNNVIRMIRDMQELGIETRVKAVLTSYNADGIASYFDMLYSLGIRRMQLVQYGRSGTRHSDDIYPSDAQMEAASETVRAFKAAHPDVELTAGGFEKSYDEPVVVEKIDKDTIFAKRAICNAGRFSMTLMPNGEVLVCEQLPYDKKYVLGDLRVQSVAECWNGARMNEWLSPPSRAIFPASSPCAACPDEYYDECHKVYSRCLRFIYEVLRTTETADIKCPRITFQKQRTT